MAVRIGIGVVILVAVGLLAWWLQRRPPAPPPRDSYPVPTQLDRRDFARPDAAWLVALFSSTDCDSCQGLGEKMLALESSEVATTELELHGRGELHRRYEIAAIPTTVIADADGVVRKSFVGAFTATDLWAAVAELRDASSTPGASA
jgi:hypothetical protein